VYETIKKANQLTALNMSVLDDSKDVIPPTHSNSSPEDVIRSYNIFKTLSWNILDTYFKSNPDYLVSHHIDSFNQFIESGIKKIFLESNPLKYIEFLKVVLKKNQIMNII
jgi:DNA-directed RNA polymerase beta subunit